MLAINPQYLTFSKLLDGRLFTIPEYQRAYSWTPRERKDLFEDIRKLHLMESDDGHFMAAIVCLMRKKVTLGTDEYHVVEVVDGQQRLTTLIILLNAIKISLNEMDKNEAKLRRELRELLVKVEGDELLLLQTNHDSSHHFSTFIRNDISDTPDMATTLADREILNAIYECHAFVADWKRDNFSLSSLAALLKNKLFFLLHQIEHERAVYNVFEVLNSRGLPVSWLDRLKSILMGAAFELKRQNSAQLIDDLHNIWRDIYSVIGLRPGLGTEVLRFAATLRALEAPSRPLGEQESVDVLRANMSSAKQIRDVAQWLLQVTKACHIVAANPRINAVTRISQARLLATAIYLRNDIKPAQREALLAKWEKVSFRIYGMFGYDARTRVGDYVRLAWRTVNEQLASKAIGTAIGEIGNDYPIEEALKWLRKTNCYEGWESELRYFMFRYEEFLAKKNNLNFQNEQWERIWLVSPSNSIEHIWAKSKATERAKHRLGNLVLLPPNLNSKLQSRTPRSKAPEYRRTGLLIAGEVADRIDGLAGLWNSKAIEDRETELLKWAWTEWAD